MYAQDWDEELLTEFYNAPEQPNLYWYNVIQPYLKNIGILKCPSDSSSPVNGIVLSYIANGDLASQDTNYLSYTPLGNSLSSFVNSPSDVYLMVEGFGITPYWWYTTLLSAKDGRRTSYYWQDVKTQAKDSAFHNGGMNFLYCDGHVQWERPVWYGWAFFDSLKGYPYVKPYTVDPRT